MKYSIDEIDRMRNSIKMSYPSGVGYHAEERSKEIEDRLRTYMLNGTTVQELEAWAEQKRKEDIARWDAEQEVLEHYRREK